MDDFHAISTWLGRLWILRSILVASLLANMAEEQVAALVVYNGSGMHAPGFAGFSHLALCSACFVVVVLLGILDIKSMSPLYFAVFSAVGRLR